MKKIMSGIVCVALMFGVLGGFPVRVSAAGEPYITHNLPKTMKIGDTIRKYDAQFHNLIPNEWVFAEVTTSGDIRQLWGGAATYDPSHVGSNGIVRPNAFFNTGEIFTPGTMVCQPSYQYWAGDDHIDYGLKGDRVNVGSPIKITVEAPVISHNAPATIQVGSTLNFETALTNINLKNEKVSDYAEAFAHDAHDGNSHEYFPLHGSRIVYQPIVEIVEGKGLVKQSNPDYSNTLKASETFSFNKIGTVKIKVTYHQIINTYGLTYDKDLRYHPEKTITINVTGGGSTNPPTNNPASSTGGNKPTQTTPQASSAGSSASGTTSSEAPPASAIDERPVVLADEETGVKIGAQDGVLPEGTVLVVSKSNVVLQDAAGKFAAFDISLENNNVKIQPNGKVLVSIPIPTGYDKERLAIYYIDEGGTKTELPSTIDGDNISFETEHFSTYVVAEKEAAPVDTSSTAPAEPVDKEPAKNNLWWLWVVLGVVVLAGGGAAVWYFKFRKTEKN